MAHYLRRGAPAEQRLAPSARRWPKSCTAATAAQKIESLYRGRRLSLEFRRTVSRLVEMQSPDYLHAAHLS
jgi:hypothetical protein